MPELNDYSGHWRTSEGGLRCSNSGGIAVEVDARGECSACGARAVPEEPS